MCYWEHPVLKLFIFFLFSAFTFCVAAEEMQTSSDFGDYRIHYNVFNSTVVPPNVGVAHGLKRGEDIAYLNVAVTKKQGDYYTLGLPAAITGEKKNLLAQQSTLKFITVKEETVTYYLAKIRFNNEEIFHLDIEVTPEGQSEVFKFRITRKLYIDP